MAIIFRSSDIIIGSLLVITPHRSLVIPKLPRALQSVILVRGDYRLSNSNSILTIFHFWWLGLWDDTSWIQLLLICQNISINLGKSFLTYILIQLHSFHLINNFFLVAILAILIKTFDETILPFDLLITNLCHLFLRKLLIWKYQIF